MTNPRVLLFPADNTGCGNQRLRWPAAALVDRGFDVHVVPPGAQELTVVLQNTDGVDHVKGVSVPECDVVVIQRPLNRLVAEAMILLAETTRVVVELDDDFSVLPQGNAAWRVTHPRLSPDANWHHLESVIRAADHLVVTSDALARRYRHVSSASVVPNYIPARYLELTRPPHPGVMIGWPGNAAVHPGDLTVARPAVDWVTGRSPSGFYILGPGPTPNCTGWLEGDDYATAIAELDVGIAPLADNAFNRAKSWLKPLELAACGTPFVASTAMEYATLADRYGIGHGWLATTPKQWRSLLMALACDPDRRAEVAATHRAQIRAHRLTIEERCDEFHEAWTVPLR